MFSIYVIYKRSTDIRKTSRRVVLSYVSTVQVMVIDIRIIFLFLLITYFLLDVAHVCKYNFISYLPLSI